MSLAWRQRAPFLAIAFVLLAALALEAQTSSTAARDSSCRKRFGELHRQAALVDALALNAVTGGLPTYDPLVHAFDALSANVAGLARDLDDPPKELEAHVAAHFARIERLKARRGILNNTQTQLPALLSKLAADGDAAAGPLQADILRFTLTGNEGNLGVNNDALSSPLKNHVGILVKDGRELDQIRHELLAAPLSADIADVAAQFEKTMSGKAATASLERGALLIVALLIALAGLWLPRR